MRWVLIVLAGMGLVLSAGLISRSDQPDTASAQIDLSIRLLHPDGTPAVGARVGLSRTFIGSRFSEGQALGESSDAGVIRAHSFAEKQFAPPRHVSVPQVREFLGLKEFVSTDLSATERSMVGRFWDKVWGVRRLEQICLTFENEVLYEGDAFPPGRHELEFTLPATGSLAIEIVDQDGERLDRRRSFPVDLVDDGYMVMLKCREGLGRKDFIPIGSVLKHREDAFHDSPQPRYFYGPRELHETVDLEVPWTGKWFPPVAEEDRVTLISGRITLDGRPMDKPPNLSLLDATTGERIPQAWRRFEEDRYWFTGAPSERAMKLVAEADGRFVPVEFDAIGQGSKIDLDLRSGARLKLRYEPIVWLEATVESLASPDDGVPVRSRNGTLDVSGLAPGRHRIRYLSSSGFVDGPEITVHEGLNEVEQRLRLQTLDIKGIGRSGNLLTLSRGRWHHAWYHRVWRPATPFVMDPQVERAVFFLPDCMPVEVPLHGLTSVRGSAPFAGGVSLTVESPDDDLVLERELLAYYAGPGAFAPWPSGNNQQTVSKRFSASDRVESRPILPGRYRFRIWKPEVVEPLHTFDLDLTDPDRLVPHRVILQPAATPGTGGGR